MDNPNPIDTEAWILWESLRAQLRSERKAQGMTQVQLGELLGLNGRTISYYESDSRSMPNLATFIRWTSVLGKGVCLK
jgi:transcriptional regulator with XRE-family HTH domain